MKLALLFSICLYFLPQLALALDWEEIKLRVYYKGEGIAGEEFIAANEKVADYLSTLERPTNKLGVKKYICHAKGRTIRPTVYDSGSATAPYRYVWIRTVYDIKECNPE